MLRTNYDPAATVMMALVVSTFVLSAGGGSFTLK